ncbi:MAG TPA: TetR/AcrR family transcriptional regulator [Caulobacteraceae bacterium]|jgi:AcrR family transcriptional regulator|nr:TetR/AcrR family transcriptional regulator [Caulobacteraceae bacterium]
MTANDDHELRSERKRKDILSAARRRFMIEGYASTGMEAVAREATVSTATLYSYFPSKADLFQHVIEDAAGSFSAHISEVTRSGGDGVSQLRAFTHAYARFMSEPFVRSVFRLVAAERRRFETVARYFFERGRTDFGGTLIHILKRLEDEGLVHVEKPSWAAGQLMGMIEHPVFLVPMVTGDETHAARGLEAIADDAVNTFMARYGTAARARAAS